MNQAKAGQAVAVKFSLMGDQGLNILGIGSPSSVQVACPSEVPINDMIETLANSNSGLTYDAGTDQYVYIWKTDKAWNGTCRQLNVVLADGTNRVALFSFVK